jgi:hypothetical protein
LADAVERARADLQKRLAELKDEQARIERALAALGGSPARRGPGRPRGSASTNGRRRRRRGGASRSDQALELIRQNPGITIPQIAEQMKLKHPNYLYRLLPGLEADGAIRKDGRGWVAA